MKNETASSVNMWPAILMLFSGFVFGFVVGDTKHHQIKPDNMNAPPLAGYTTPRWISQNIDSITSCNIILSEGLSIVKVGNTFTCVYSEGSNKGYKVDKKSTGLDFDYIDHGMIFYSDTCALKEDLRQFVKIQIVKGIDTKKRKK